MMKHVSLLLACSFFMYIVSAQNDLLPSEGSGKKYDLYILAGQSNMAGRGLVTGEFITESDPRVFVLDKDSKWIQARHPLHFDKAAAGVGPGLSFGIKMAKEKPRALIGLIPCAVGGTSIEKWEPGAYDAVTKTHPYDDALVRIKEAMKYGNIKGVIWHQGEANSSEAKAAVYMDKMKVLIQRFRDVTGIKDLPFIAGELGRYKPAYNNINTVLAELPQLVPYTGVVSSEGLTDKGDGTHFDSPSATILGQRFAEKMIEAQSAKKRK